MAEPAEHTKPEGPGGLRHKGGLPALLALLVGAALGALAILFAHALNEINKEVGDPPDNLRWAVSDLEHEFLRLRLASERTAQSGSAADFQALKLRLDIFASRIPILQVGTFRRKLDERPDLAAILAQAEATLARADEVLLQAETLGRRQTAQALSQALEPLAPALRRMTVRVGQLESQQQADYQTEMQRLLVLIVLVFIVLAAGVLAFVVLLWLQHRRLSQSNASLSRLSHELFQANQTKSRFLANMSHELRTPLNAVLGFSEIMREQHFGPLAPRYRGYAEDIHRSANHLLELINDVLDLSKLEAGRRQLDRSDLSIGVEFDYVSRLLTSKAEGAGLRLIASVEPDLPPVPADRLALRQVLLNLVVNAIKFSPPGGRVTLRAARAGDCLQVCVIDEGIGIAASDLERILQPFEQVRSQIGAAAEGTGLGLPLSKGLVELHGGEMWIDSQPGAGTTVSFTLPLRREGQETPGGPAAGFGA